MAPTLSTTSNDVYLKLIQSFPLRPIRARNSHQRAKMVLRGLAGKRGPAVRDYKAVLVSLIAEYERRANMQLDTSKVTAAEVVTHLLDERGMSIDRLAKSLGIPQNSLNDMLHDRMEWSKSAIMAISSHFGLQPMLFLR